MFYLENLVNVTEYNISNGLNLLQISTSIKVKLEHFSQALAIFETITFQNYYN